MSSLLFGLLFGLKLLALLFDLSLSTAEPGADLFPFPRRWS